MQDPGDLARAAVVAGTDRVIGIGGDGTITAIAAGLIGAERPVPLAVIPRGTANVLAMNFNIPWRLSAAINVAMNGEVATIDAGRVDHESFLLTVGTGLHTEVLKRSDRALKQRFGFVAYGLALPDAARAAPPVHYRITCDDEAHEVDATMIQVMNCGAFVLQKWELVKGLSPVDGILDVFAFRTRSVHGLMAQTAQIVLRRRRAAAEVLRFRGRRVRLEADPPVQLQRDGELAGFTPAEIEVLPRALSVVAAPRSPWAE